EALLPVVDAARHFALHVVHELVHLVLHQFDLAAQIEDDFHTGQVHTQVTGEREDGFELLEIFFRVESGIPVRTRRLQQPLTLVEPQRLGMNVVLLRHRADHEVRLPALSPLGHRRYSRTGSALILPNSRSNSFERSARSRGNMIRTSTIRSPRISCRVEGAPCPRRRKRCPVCVPGGMRRRTAPSSERTSTRAPNAASCTARLTVISRSSPSRRNAGCEPTFTVTYKSP